MIFRLFAIAALLLPLLALADGPADNIPANVRRVPKLGIEVPAERKTKLEAGMTFSDEPGVYIPGEFGVRLEDIMVITDRGAELFTGQAASIENPCATA